MNASVVNIDDRRHNRLNVEPDIERVKRALAAEFAELKPLGSYSFVERYVGNAAGGEAVELRVLSARASRDRAARELFYLEADAASRLDHMNIPGTSKPEHTGGIDYCVIEHKPNARSLRALLHNDGWLDVKDAAGIADQLASALDHANQQGVLHLKLEPGCVLIEPDGWVTLADFGIDARNAIASGRQPRAPYASPEQSTGGELDLASDLYSLGVLLYEMLTDRSPFDSNDAEYVRQKQMTSMPAAPHLIFPDVPEAVSAVVMKLLATEPKHRFASAAAFQAALYDAVS
ncbi:MAG TPA: serine/threonine-protein kinase [Blastocatellia bacterium]|nr:serine/threonine-protein kinase [Blastocatellia bacterium]